MLEKLAKQAGAGCGNGTFAPVWQVLRASAEKLLSLHVQMVQKVSELVKEVTKYADELQKKHKQVSNLYILHSPMYVVVVCKNQDFSDYKFIVK